MSLAVSRLEEKMRTWRHTVQREIRRRVGNPGKKCEQQQQKQKREETPYVPLGTSEIYSREQVRFCGGLKCHYRDQVEQRLITGSNNNNNNNNNKYNNNNNNNLFAPFCTKKNYKLK